MVKKTNYTAGQALSALVLHSLKAKKLFLHNSFLRIIDLFRCYLCFFRFHLCFFRFHFGFQIIYKFQHCFSVVNIVFFPVLIFWFHIILCFFILSFGYQEMD